MPPLLELLCAYAAATALYLLVTALCGQAFGIRLREISFGYGPTVLRFGRYRLGLIPRGGAVRFVLSGDQGADPAGAFDTQPGAVRFLVAASGCLVLLVLSLLLLGRAGLDAFLSAFGQIYALVAHPFSEGQQLLGNAMAIAGQTGLSTLTALAAAKVSAFNLLPASGSSGEIMLGVIGRGLGMKQESFHRLLLMLLALALFLGTHLAVLYFLFTLA